MRVRINSNNKVRLPGKVIGRVIVVLRIRRSIVKFTAKAHRVGGSSYIVIPKNIRDAYGLKPGTTVEILSILQLPQQKVTSRSNT